MKNNNFFKKLMAVGLLMCGSAYTYIFSAALDFSDGWEKEGKCYHCLRAFLKKIDTNKQISTLEINDTINAYLYLSSYDLSWDTNNENDKRILKKTQNAIKDVARVSAQ